MKDKSQVAEALSVLTRHLLAEGAPGAEASREAEPWLSVERAARHADVSPDTIRKWVESGRLRVGRVGRVLRIRASDIDAMLLMGPDDGDPRAHGTSVGGEGGGRPSGAPGGARSQAILEAITTKR